MRILLTGSTGFVGGAILPCLQVVHNYELLLATRQTFSPPTEVQNFIVGDINPNTDWQQALQRVRVVIHAAARAHVIYENVANPLAEFRRVNVGGTLNLARQAAISGVNRFIFLSSIGVNGDNSGRIPFDENSKAAPYSPYSISKWEAEIGLLRLAQETGMEIVIIRPPLVYGPGAPGNFGRLLRTVASGILLPLGAIHNKRSLVALDNLVDLIITCIDHPNAANQTFLVSDGEDLSTTALLRRTANALGKPARLIPVPQPLLESGLRLVGKGDLAQRLCGSLQVDISKTRELLGWAPPLSVDEALKKTADDFLARLE